MEALRERGVAAAAVIAEISTSAEEEAESGGEVAGSPCMWPPLETEYFFGENADPSELFRRTRIATVTRYYFSCCIHYIDHQKLRKVSALVLCLVMQEHWI